MSAFGERRNSPAVMSAFGGIADVRRTARKRPLIAKSGLWSFQRGRALVAHDAVREAREDWRQDGPSWAVRHVPACRGCSIARSIRAGPGLDCRPASATAKASMTKRIRMSEAVQQAKCAKPRVNHAWMAGFVAINGHWAKMAANLIWIIDSISELCVLYQTEGALFAKCRLG